MRHPVITLLFACALAFVSTTGIATAQPAGGTPRPAKAAPAAAETVNLNTATAAQLESLPGIGARTAERIIEYRQKNGPFKKIEELMNVKGIGEKSFLKLKDRLTVTPPAARAGQ